MIITFLIAALAAHVSAPERAIQLKGPVGSHRIGGDVVSGLVLPHEVYAGLADLVLVVHLAFILFVAIGAFVAWRWPRVRWVHILAVVYAAAIVTVGFDCPLTGLEKHLRGLAGGPVYDGGFVSHYLTDVIYPGHSSVCCAG